jgi:glycosyltransferase involved in cell wall biosynthesis
MAAAAHRTLHLVEYLNQGGIERVLESLARHTPRDRIALSFYTYESERIEGMGAEISALGLPVFHGKKRPGYDLRLLGRLVRVVKERGIDVVHTHDFGPMEYAVALKLRFPRLRLVHTHHTLHHFLPVRRYRAFFQATSLLYDAILCVSPHVRSELSRHCPLARAKLRTVCNGVDAAALAPAGGNRRLAKGAKALRLVGVSRISPEKNLLHTLEALRDLRRRGIAFEYHHAGSGTAKEERRVKDFVRRHDLARHVHWHGFVTDVRPVLAKGDVFVSSSRTEGHPVAVLEAMASGKVCVLSDIPPHRDLAPGSAVLFPLEKGALADRLRAIAKTPKSYRSLVERARKEVVSRYSIEATVDQYCRAYERSRQ